MAGVPTEIADLRSMFAITGIRADRLYPASSVSDRINCAACRFSRRCASDDVPGISKMLGERCKSQASATCIGVASTDSAILDNSDDWIGVNPPSGKNGT